MASLTCYSFAFRHIFAVGHYLFCFLKGGHNFPFGIQYSDLQLGVFRNCTFLVLVDVRFMRKYYIF